MIRFHIKLGDDTLTTDWQEEPITHRQGGIPTAVMEMTRLRQQYPEASIGIERKTIIPQPERKLFRFDINVRQGTMVVVDDDGEHLRDVSGLTLQSDLFQETETERVLAHLKEKFPEATFTRREVRRG